MHENILVRKNNFCIFSQKEKINKNALNFKKFRNKKQNIAGEKNLEP